MLDVTQRKKDICCHFRVNHIQSATALHRCSVYMCRGGLRLGFGGMEYKAEF